MSIDEHPDWQSAARELDGRVSGKADDSDVEELRRDLQLAGEALHRIWGMLDDLLNSVEVDRSEYEDDLDRLEQLARLLS